MITEWENQRTRELLLELLALVEDPSEWLKEEVSLTVEVLEGSLKYDTSDIVEMIEERNRMNDIDIMKIAEEVLAKNFDTVTLTITPEGEQYVTDNTTNTDEQMKVLALIADLANAAAKAEDIIAKVVKEDKKAPEVA